MKHFTDTYLNSYDILNDAIIGMEFEFYSNISIPNAVMSLTQALKRNVQYINEYHPDIKPSHDLFLLTPDYSGGSDMLELITSPLSYIEARLVLSSVYKVIQKIGYTDDASGMHINISFKSKDISKINYLKLMMIMDETKVYDAFPDREDNIYCRSVKNYLPHSGFDFSDISASVIATTMNFDTENRYYGINLSTIKNGRIEYRYIGGENYSDKIDDTLDLLDYFILTTNESFSNLTKSENVALIDYLGDKMKEYKNLNTLQGFIGKFPNVRLEVNRNVTFDYVNSFYINLFDDLYIIIKALNSIDKCEFIINYDSNSNQFELVNYEGDISGLLDNILFIRAEITGGDYTFCEFYDSIIKKVNMTSCVTYNCEVFESKLIETNCVKYTELNDCYFTKGYLDCLMTGGVFRNGTKGENAEINPTVRIDNKKGNSEKKG